MVSPLFSNINCHKRQKKIYLPDFRYFLREKLTLVPKKNRKFAAVTI